MAGKDNNQNNQVATTQGNGVDVFAGLDQFSEFKQQGTIEGLEVMDSSDIKLPKYKLLQQTSVEVSKNKGKAGQFYNVITGETTDKLECVLLKLGKSRVMFKKPFKRGEAPLCRSFDGKSKFEGIGEGNCEKCKFGRWDNLADGQNKPDCNMSYVWLGVTAGTNKTPFRIIAAGMNVSITKDFLNTIAPRRLPPFVYKVVLTSEQKENESGIFYIMKYNIVGTIDKADFPALQDMSISMGDLFSKTIENDTLVNDENEGTDNAAPANQNPANGQFF